MLDDAKVDEATATTQAAETDALEEPDSYVVSPDLIARMKSLQWFSSGRPEEDESKYEGMRVAILGERVLDMDRDVEELIRRIDARGDSIPQDRVAFTYVPTRQEFLLYFSK